MIWIYLLVAIVLIGVLFLFFFPLVKICGNSMYPTLKDGQYFLSVRVFNTKKLKVGEIYIFRPPYSGNNERFVIKRLTCFVQGKCQFLGDNSRDSYDSRYYGFVPSKRVVSRLLIRKKV